MRAFVEKTAASSGAESASPKNASGCDTGDNECGSPELPEQSRQKRGGACRLDFAIRQHLGKPGNSL